jgi:hypothetical protein
MKPTGRREAPPDGAIREQYRRARIPDFAEPVIGRAFVRPVGSIRATTLRSPRYCETVCTTLLTGRVLATGTFMSLTSASSYSGNVCNGALAFICTTL